MFRTIEIVYVTYIKCTSLFFCQTETKIQVVHIVPIFELMNCIYTSE